jgi:hypothetical protein
MRNSEAKEYLILAGICIHSPDIKGVQDAILSTLPSKDENTIAECIRGLGHMAWRFKKVDEGLLHLVHARAFELRESQYIQDVWKDVTGPGGDINTFVPQLKIPSLR